MDGVQLPQGYSHFEEAIYFLPFTMKVRYFCGNTKKLNSYGQFCMQSLKLFPYAFLRGILKDIKQTQNEKYDLLYKELNVKEKQL